MDSPVRMRSIAWAQARNKLSYVVKRMKNRNQYLETGMILLALSCVMTAARAGGYVTSRLESQRLPGTA